MLYEEKIIETIPVGPLGLIPLKGCAELGKKVDDYLVSVFGNEELVNTFKDKLTQTYENAKVISEDGIV